MKEIIAVLLMLEVRKEDRAVCSIMLKYVTREYSSVRDNMIIHFPRNNEIIERGVCFKYLESSVKSKPIKKPNG